MIYDAAQAERDKRGNETQIKTRKKKVAQEKKGKKFSDIVFLGHSHLLKKGKE